MFPIDGYRAYTPVQWSDPDANFGPNDSFYTNDIERSDYLTEENIYKSNEFNEIKTDIAAYNMAAVSSYLFVPLYGAMQQNPATSSLIWQQQQEQAKPKRQVGRCLSSDATPFIPSKSETSE